MFLFMLTGCQRIILSGIIEKTNWGCCCSFYITQCLNKVINVLPSVPCSRRSLPDHRRAVQAVAPTGCIHGGRLPQLDVQLHHRLCLPLPRGQSNFSSTFNPGSTEDIFIMTVTVFDMRKSSSWQRNAWQMCFLTQLSKRRMNGSKIGNKNPQWHTILLAK